MSIRAEVVKYFKELIEDPLNDRDFSSPRFVGSLYEWNWCKKYFLTHDLSDNAQEIILEAEILGWAASQGEF